MSWRDSPDTMKNDFVRYDQRILKILLQDRTTKKISSGQQKTMKPWGLRIMPRKKFFRKLWQIWKAVAFPQERRRTKRKKQPYAG